MATPDIEKLKLKVEVWKKTVDVQQHFNDLELRIRNFAVTVLSAVLGAAGLALNEKLVLSIGGWSTPLASWFIGVGVVAWLAFYFMDRWWYHRLLYGAVTYGAKLEKELEKELPGTMGLGDSISTHSSFYIAGWRVRTPHKIDLFYGTVTVLLLIVAVVLRFSVQR